MAKVSPRAEEASQRIRDKRQRKGECPGCGIRLYKTTGVLGKKRTPITIKGHIENGRCLACNPTQQPTAKPPPVSPTKTPPTAPMEVPRVPEFLHVPNDSGGEPFNDAGTVISGITLDQHFVQPVAVLDDSVRRRSIDEDVMTRPDLPPRERSVRNPLLELPRETREETKEEIDRQDNPPTNHHTEIFFDSSNMLDLATAEQEPVSAAIRLIQPERKAHQDIELIPESLQSDPASLAVTQKRRLPSGSDSLFQVANDKNVSTKNTGLSDFDEEELKKLLSSWKPESRVPDIRDLEQITSHLWKGGKKAKTIFHESKGYQGLTQLIWTNMTHEPLEEKAVELFLSTVILDQAEDKSDEDFDSYSLLATEEAREATEAILFVMQSLSHNKNVQLTACRALVCLANLSGMSEGRVDDGSSSGAVAVVVNSMATHSNSQKVENWCLRVLFELCSVSSSAESNKRILLLASTLEGGGSGLDVVVQSLDKMTIEAIRLVWCLSASEHAQNRFPNDVLVKLVNHFSEIHTTASGDLMEALLGSINNLYVLCDNEESTRKVNEVAKLAFDAAQRRENDAGLCIEVFALIANAASMNSDFDKEWFGKNECVSFVSKLIQKHDDCEALQEECICALLSLAMGCQTIKTEIQSPVVFFSLKQLGRVYERSAKWQELLCTLIASTVISNDYKPLACEKDAIGVVCVAMTLHDNVRVREACSIALRNLSSRRSAVKHMKGSEATDLVIDSMVQSDSKAIFINGSEILWNMSLSASDVPEKSQILISGLLKGMRAHLDEVSLLKSALNILLKVMVGSDENKKKFCDDSGMEVITCIMVMHGNTESLLIKSCGLLASLSCLPELVPPIVEAGAINSTVEILRSGHPSTELLMTGSQFLTNALLAAPEECGKAGEVVGTLIERMRDCPHEIEFQSEACRLLWAIASLSEPIRTRILEMDGVSVLMKLLEENKEGDIHSNARQCIDELTVATPQLEVGERDV